MGIFNKKSNVIVQPIVEPIKKEEININMQEQDYQKLLKKLMGFVPIDKRENVDHLYYVFDVIYSLMSGDDIQKYIANEELENKHIKGSFEAIIKTVQEKSLLGYKEEIEKNKQELLSVQTKINESNDIYTQMQEKINVLKQENDKLSLANQTIQTQMTNTQDELQKVQAEIEKLQAIKNSFLTVVNWMPITKDDPIYALDRTTFKSYINSIIKIYAKELNVSLEEAEDAIRVNSPGLFTLKKLLEDLRYGYDTYNIRAMVTEAETGKPIYEKWVMITYCMHDIKLPQFSKVNNNFYANGNQTNSNFDDISVQIESQNSNLIEQDNFYR